MPGRKCDLQESYVIRGSKLLIFIIKLQLNSKKGIAFSIIAIATVIATKAHALKFVKRYDGIVSISIEKREDVVLPKLRNAHVIGKALWNQGGDNRDVISIGKLVRKKPAAIDKGHSPVAEWNYKRKNWYRPLYS